MIILDSGAIDGNWITRAKALECGAPIRKLESISVELAKDVQVITSEFCTPRLQIQEHVSTPVCYIIDNLPGNNGVILGTPWLNQFSVSLSHKPKGVGIPATYLRAGKRLKLFPITVPHSNIPDGTQGPLTDSDSDFVSSPITSNLCDSDSKSNSFQVLCSSRGLLERVNAYLH